MKKENWILEVINGYKTFVWNHGPFTGSMDSEIKKVMKTIVNNYSGG